VSETLVGARRFADGVRERVSAASVSMAASIGIYLLVAASYAQPRISDDGVIYYDFMRRLFGEDVKAYAYQFGVVFWNLPFYGVFRTFSWITGVDTFDGRPIGLVAIAVASSAAVVVTFFVARALLRELDLPFEPWATLLAVFGTPLFYYAIFQPGLKHAVDALVATVLGLLLVRAARAPEDTRLALAIGLVGAALITLRYANITLLVGPLYVFLRTHAYVKAYLVITVALVGATVVLLIPLALGVPYGLPPTPPPVPAAGAAPVRVERPARSLASAIVVAEQAPTPTRNTGGGVDNLSSFQFAPAAPLKMLFTLKRGLFVWTPLTLLATFGYILVIRRRPQDRVFLVGLGLSAIALLAIHSIWGAFWAGGYSFSQRFLTALFPLFVIGTAELLRRWRLAVVPALVLCIAWTAFLAVHHFYGYDGVSEADGVGRMVELYVTGEESPGSFWRERITGPIGRHWRAYFDVLTP